MSVRVFPERLAFELVNWVEQTALSSVGGHHPTFQNRTKRQRKGKCMLSLLERRLPASPALGRWGPWFLGFQAHISHYATSAPTPPWCSGLWTHAEWHHWLSWFPSLLLADLGPDLHNCVNQFLQCISSYLYFSLYPIGSVFLGNPNTDFGTENGSRGTEF